MVRLVEYSESDTEGEDEKTQHASKKRKTSSLSSATDDKTRVLPPLPASFRDLYSSTVRTSTQDDPSLHAGRKRTTPHVTGSWPAHVYLECELTGVFPLVLSLSASFIQFSLRRKSRLPTKLKHKADLSEGIHRRLNWDFLMNFLRQLANHRAGTKTKAESTACYGLT